MRLLEIKYPYYLLKHKHGYEFKVKAYRTIGGCLTFEPIVGWDALSVFCQQDTESLLEDIDDVIYNTTPEAYDETLGRDELHEQD